MDEISQKTSIISNLQIYNMDCQIILDDLIEKKIRVDSIIVDLPYFQVVKDEFDNQWKTEEQYLAWVAMQLLKCNQVLKENGNLLIFCSRQNTWKICHLLNDLHFTEQRQIIWARKRGFNNTRGKALASGYEPILYWTRGETGTFNNIKIKVDSDRKEYKTGTLKDGITLSDVWTDIPALPHNSKEKVNHPTQKPLKLMERLVEVFTNPGDVVLDFCMGSGTTGVACKKLGRKFIGCEKDKEYFTIAFNRIRDVKIK